MKQNRRLNNGLLMHVNNLIMNDPDTVKAARKQTVFLSTQLCKRHSGKFEQRYTLGLVCLVYEDAFFVCIKTESGLRSFEMINIIYRDLARAKSEALDNFCSLFKQNIKWCNAKRRRQRRLTVKNNNKSLVSKIATLHVQHTFFVHFFANVLHDYNVKTCRNFGVTRFKEEMSDVFSFTFLSLPLILALVAASIFNFDTAATKFSYSSNKKMCPLFLTLALDLSLSFAGLPPASSF